MPNSMASHSRMSPSRHGFTIVELVVCIGIVGLLTALIVPAVQSAREASRTLHCKSNLRQIGVALHAFESAHHRFPFGGDMVWDGSGGASPRAHAPHLYILPYVDQGPLFSRLNLLVAADRNIAVIPGVNDANEAFKATPISLFLCPSDTSAFAQRRNNYRASVGVTAFPRFANVAPNPRLAGYGAFYPVHRPVRAHSFTDGLSSTVGFSERLAGDGDPTRFSPARDYFFLHAVMDPQSVRDSPLSTSLHVKACASLKDPNPPHESTVGGFWFYAGLTDTWYDHLFTPNSPSPDCAEFSGIEMDGSGVITARSVHPGGVNSLLMDGGVRFVANTINSGVWQALGTRNGREGVSFE